MAYSLIARQRLQIRNCTTAVDKSLLRKKASFHSNRGAVFSMLFMLRC
jgi:hypothetical protein